ncbi:MAG: cellulase family glycosylhydrolase [Candidatus Omnitrophica bacterium]|nr:cellulase family glycosylhydrolase [Candidatus Omnitrophota bacterium]
MKTKIFAILTIVFFLSSNICLAQEPVLPGEQISNPGGSTVDDLISGQSSAESLVETQQAIAEALSAGFVTAQDTGLYVDGQEYKFSHANNYYLFYKPDYMIDEIFEDAQRLGLNAIRTWGFCDGMYKEGVSFQPSYGVYDETGFLKMDYILYKAAQYDMKLIIPFVNNWDDFGGINQYVEWFLGRQPSYSEHDLFYTNETIKDWYRDYVTYFVNRTNTYTGIAYKDDPTVLMWELGNEPRAYGDSTGDTLNPWINEMAEYVKGVDPNHLLSTGIEGWYGYSDGVDFIESQSSPYVDVATFHLFPDYYNLSDEQALQWIRDRASDAQNVLNKPVYIGEFGKMVDRSAPDVRTQTKARDGLYRNIYNTAASSGANGVGFWILYGDSYPDYDNFGVYYPSDRSTNRVIKSGSELFVTSSGGSGGSGGGKDKENPGKGNKKNTTSNLSSDINTSLQAYKRRLLKKSSLDFYNDLLPASGNLE